MHIAEGILSGPSIVATWALGAAAVAWGLNRTQVFIKERPEQRPLLSLAAAVVFLVSLMPLPGLTGMTTTHPCGTPWAAILLGPGVTVVLGLLGMALQAAFFSHGGFGSLGANTLTLGLVGGLSGWATYHAARRVGASRFWAAFLGGMIGDLLTYAAAGGILGAHLAFVLPQPQMGFASWLKAIYWAYVPIQGPISVLEGLLTAWAIQAMARQRPEILEDLGVEKKKTVGGKKKVALALLLFIALPLALQAAAYQGMDEVVNEALATAGGAPARAPFLNTEEMGDLWNFILLAGGATAGFIIGKNWQHVFAARPLTPKPAKRRSKPAAKRQ